VSIVLGTQFEVCFFRYYKNRAGMQKSGLSGVRAGLPVASCCQADIRAG
jgi:hypothetical protein